MAKLSVTSGNAVVGDASEYLFEHGRGDHGTDEDPIVFADLTNADKLALVQTHQKEVIVALANSFRSNRDQKEAREAAEASKHSL